MPELLLELLSEEIPARMQARAADDLKRLVTDGLKDAGLEFDSADAFVTPRRLALVVDGIPEKLAAKSEERRGPRTDAPDQAVKGFRGSLPKGAKVEKRETEKGAFYFALINKKGVATNKIIPQIVNGALWKLSWPKSMKWGADNRFSWVRPIHSILCVFAEKPIGLSLQRGIGDAVIGQDLTVGDNPIHGIVADNITKGHPYLAPKPFKVKNFADYKAKLLKAKVVLDPAERRQMIEAEAGKLAGKAGLKFKHDPGLLAEVAGLVEWPVVRMGSIDKAFMGLPPEVLTTVMRYHQKYFALVDKNGRLQPKFIVVANTETRDHGKAMVAGNERVLRARLSDAKFFWDQDLKRRLDDRVQELGGRVFHAKLGTLLDKVLRVEQLAHQLAGYCDANPGDAMWAARLAKADLSTEMIGEFPELQGVMGRYYALADKEKPDVADAIAEHYSPLGPNDACPSKPVSVAVALADKIDTLAGFWTIGEKPTGSKDPFALRRAALGVIRLIVENGLRVPLLEAFEGAKKGLDDTIGGTGDDWAASDLLAFIADRLKVHLREKGVRHDHIDAVFSVKGSGGEDDLVRLLARVEALGQFLKTDDGGNLLTAYKRAANIVRIEQKNDGRKYDAEPETVLLSEPEEDELYNKLLQAGPKIRTAIEDERFQDAMQKLASVRKDVDAFFDNVTVNTDQPDLRRNRLNLLSFIGRAFDNVADFSKIEGGDQ